MDIWYVKNRNFILDLKIIVLTIKKLLYQFSLKKNNGLVKNLMEKIDLIGIYGAGGCGRGIAPLLLKKFKSKNKIVFIDDTKHKKIINEFECINYKEFLKIKKNKK